MNKVLALAAVFCLAAVPPPLPAQDEAATRASEEMRALLRYEPTGLSLLHPYVRGKVPVVFVHGLWVSPWSWLMTIRALEADPVIDRNFQFWTFGYSTGDPIPYSAYLLRRDLDEVRRKFDPGKTDPAFDRMVLVGHSMGGLLCKMIAVDSGDRLWRTASDYAVGALRGEEGDAQLLRDCLIFGAHPGVRRVVYIATPHRGSRFDRGAIHELGARLVRLPDPLRAAHRRLVAQNPPGFFREHFYKDLPNSIDELEWGSPMLTGLSELPHPTALTIHSIIAIRSDSPPDRPDDGLVSYESAHIAGVASEKVVRAGHRCQDHPEVIGEVRRILTEQGAQH